MRLGEPLDLVGQMVQSLYSAETQLILALPRVAARVADPGLREALEQHLKQTKSHSTRLEEVARALAISYAGKRCYAMEGLLKEGDESLGYGGDETLIDAAIITSCLSIERYEITQYQALRDLLIGASMREAANIIESTLADEDEASRGLAHLFGALSRNVTVSTPI